MEGRRNIAPLLQTYIQAAITDANIVTPPQRSKCREKFMHSRNLENST